MPPDTRFQLDIRILQESEKELKIRVQWSGIPGLSVFKGEGKGQLDLDGSTMNDLLSHLFLNMKEKCLVLNEQREILPEVLIFLNGRLLDQSARRSHRLSEGDLVELAVLSG